MDSMAFRVIEKCGGIPKAAEMAGVKVQTVYRWTYPKAKGGRDGVIPMEYALAMVAHPRAAEVGLTWQDFEPPAEPAKDAAA